MYNIQKIFILILIIIGSTVFSSNKSNISTLNNMTHISSNQEDYKKKWSEVDSLMKLGLPKSALEIIQTIYEDAKRNGNTPQYIKALLYRARVVSEYEEESLLSTIIDLQNEMKDVGFPEVNLIHSMLAELYWAYYENNSYKILDRSVTGGFLSDDIETWDLQKIVSEIIFHYQSSLERPDDLQKAQLQQFEAILETEENSKTYRPSLYDFLAHRAIDFYMNEESQLVEPVYKFTLNNPEYFAPAGEFVDLNINTQDTLSFTYYAISIFQELLSYHRNTKLSAPAVDADLKRLQFVYDNSIFDQKDSLYIAALSDLLKRHQNIPVSSRISHELASTYYDRGTKYDPLESDEYKWDWKQAHNICLDAIRNHPRSDGADNCKVLLQQIEKKDLELKLEYARPVSTASPALLSYRNTDKIWFRIIEMEPEKDRNLRRNGNREDILDEYIKKPFLKEWMLDLPDDGDFQDHSVEIAIPELDPGYYIILFSSSEKFSYKENVVGYSSIWSTNISYINRQIEGSSADFYVLHRETGHPMGNTRIKTFHREYNYNTREYDVVFWKEFTSNDSGFFSIEAFDKNERKNLMFEFIRDDDRFMSENYMYLSSNYNTPEKKRIKSFFFTDRSIYRPGQTVYFKGIILETKGDDVQIAPHYNTTVTFYDVNNQKISSVDLTSNEYGSVHGSFTIPSSVLTGNMRITNRSGTATFSVEEYKRPKFEVKINPVSGSYKLGENITVTGAAKAYAGSPVSDGEVIYRVVRSVRYPFYRYGWYRGDWDRSSEMEIVNGTTQTDESGSFSIDFTAIPGSQTYLRYDPVFDYRVYVDVIDINGETQSAQEVVSVGEKALLIDVNIPEMVNKNGSSTFTVTSTNLNGLTVHSVGEWSVFKLKDPERIFRERKWERPDRFVMTKDEFYKLFPYDVYDNEDLIENRSVDANVFKSEFDTRIDSVFSLGSLSSLKSGDYLLKIETKDEFGTKIIVEKFFTLYSTEEKYPSVKSQEWIVDVKTQGEPGENATVLLGTSDKRTKILFEVYHKRKVINSEWIELSNKQIMKTIPILESYRGNFSVGMVFIKHNRVYRQYFVVEVPYSNKKLDIEFASFRNKLLPGQEEEYSITIKDYQDQAAAAELLLSMYDVSLDAFRPHSWYFDILRYYSGMDNWEAGNSFSTRSSWEISQYPEGPEMKFQVYDRLKWFGLRFVSYLQHYFIGGVEMRSAATAQKGQAFEMEDALNVEEEAISERDVELPPSESKEEIKPPAELQIRKNLNETAFFYPVLATDEEGNIKIKYTIPEALTRWKLMGFAHTKSLSFGQIEKELVTQKKLMVIPNLPRFFRENDTIFLSTKISNLSEEKLEGVVVLEIFDPTTMRPVNIIEQQESKPFEVPAGQNTQASWMLTLPDAGPSMLGVRFIAKAANFSDGEEVTIPVLSNRMLVTESLPLPVRKKGTHEFTFNSLLDSEKSKTLKQHKLTLEFTSNPAWYAVQSLPYLMEYPYECSEQVFSRFYANTLAAYIASSSPAIKNVFESWKNITPDALLSNLEKNQELKSMVLEETPWVLDAKDETERKQRIALLFDLNKLANEEKATLNKLQQLQSPNGGWPWFKGMRDSRFVTQHIIAGLGHLIQLGVIDPDDDPMVIRMLRKGMLYLDSRIGEDYRDLLKYSSDRLEKKNIGYTQIHYLYTRSFIESNNLKVNISTDNRKAFDYYLGQAKEYWLEESIYMQAMMALTIHRYGEEKVPADIINSLREKALFSDEMGMYWRDLRPGYFWYQAPIETQALLIELFHEVANDQEAVEEMKVWLIKQKQTQNWETTKATVEAVYALLLQGTDWLVNTDLVTVSLGEITYNPTNDEDIEMEAGTGYFKTSWSGNEIDPEMGNVEVSKVQDGVAWGAVYWQYFENLDKIEKHETPLQLDKKLFVEKNSPTGPVIEPLNVNKSLEVGDKIKVRIELRVDRDMEYVHMKDMRAAAFEPVNVFSGYRYQGGLGYYESTRDAATNFFFNYLPKGTYVFEYPLVVSQSGSFSNGITTIQCMYAPEFTAHSEGVRVQVKE